MDDVLPRPVGKSDRGQGLCRHGRGVRYLNRGQFRTWPGIWTKKKRAVVSSWQKYPNRGVTGARPAAGSAHPEAVALDRVADRLFAARQVVLVEQRAHLGTAPLVDHALDRVVFLENLLDSVGGGHVLQDSDHPVALAGVEQRQGAVMAG